VLADESRHQGKQLWLVFGNRTEKDIYYHDGFVHLAAQHLNFVSVRPNTWLTH
jgi:NAD(P)H-flavin reductase